MIEQIQINEWRQFDTLTIDFDKRLTILTGANGSGKTTILNILSKVFGENIQFVSNVSDETIDGSIDYSSSVETNSGNFPIDAASGGIASIIELAWMIYMYAHPEKEFTVLFDEPENHLHPELQQTLLPNLLEAFPNVQFIIATHNPFIISSVESKVKNHKY